MILPYLFTFPQSFNSCPLFASLLNYPVIISSPIVAILLAPRRKWEITVPSMENGRFRFKEWLRGGFWQGRSGNTQQPARSTAHSSESSDKENEELDDETAPYLSDDPRNPNGRNQRTEKDLRKYDSRGGTNRVCAGCKRYIGSEAHFGCMGTFFHQKCLRCRACGQPITEHEFSLSRSNETYHKSCFKELTHPKCDVCYQFIPLNRNGLIEYECSPFWSQKYCPLHAYDSTSRCCSCERLEPWNAAYIILRDGRKLCLECKESAVMDTGESQVLYHAVRDFFEGMNVKLDQQIPFHLVDRQALNEAMVQRNMPERISIALLEDRTEPIWCLKRVAGEWQRQILVPKCEVTAILALYGLPRLVLGAHLAVQLMHSWLHLKGYRNLAPEVEGGICMYLSRIWLESEFMSTASSTKKGKRPDFDRKLGEFVVYQLTTNTARGKGYKAANAAVNKYGLRSTLEHIRMTGMFPHLNEAAYHS